MLYAIADLDLIFDLPAFFSAQKKSLALYCSEIRESTGAGVHLGNAA